MLGAVLRHRLATWQTLMGTKTLGQFLWEKLKTEQEHQRSGKKPKGIRFRGLDLLMTKSEVLFTSLRKQRGGGQCLDEAKVKKEMATSLPSH